MKMVRWGVWVDGPATASFNSLMLPSRKGRCTKKWAQEWADRSKKSHTWKGPEVRNGDDITVHMWTKERECTSKQMPA